MNLSALEIVFASLLIFISLFIIVVIMLQESKQQGMGAISGEASDNFLERSGDRSKEATMKKITKIMATLFLIIVFGLNVAIHYLK